MVPLEFWNSIIPEVSATFNINPPITPLLFIYALVALLVPIKDNVPYIILEHDGYFIKPLPTNVLDQFTDVLKLDNNDPYSKGYNKVIEQETNNPVTIEKYQNPAPKFLEKNQTGNYMKGAYGYIIKPHAAERILNWISKNGFVPSDQQIGDAIVDIKVIHPTVVRLHPNYFRKTGDLSLTANLNLL